MDNFPCHLGADRLAPVAGMSQGKDMAEPILDYDEMSDTLYVSFEPGEKATGIELNEHILLRINKNERRAVGLTFFEYSLLAQRTEVGPRSFPLTGLAQLSDELREMVLDILLRPPVSNFLSVSAYTPSFVETIPITALQPVPTAPG
jgi:uncharacterized protein YuzE